MKYFFFDLETTGLDPKKDEVIQLAYAIDKPKDIYTEYYKPQQKIPYEISGLTNIDEVDVKDKEDFKISKDLQKIKKFSEEGYIAVAHNADFDLSFLKELGVVFEKSICTMYVSKQLLKEDLQNFKLGTLRAFYHLARPTSSQAHNAAYDVEVLYNIYEKLRENFKSEEEMIAYSDKAKIEAMKVWNFGKFKGEKINNEKHGDYIQWFLGQPKDPKYPHKPEFLDYLNRVLSGEEEKEEKVAFEEGKLF